MEHPMNHPKLPHSSYPLPFTSVSLSPDSSYPLPFTLVCVSHLIALTPYLLPWCVSHLIALTLYLLPVCVSLLPHTSYLLPLVKHVHGTAVTFST